MTRPLGRFQAPAGDQHTHWAQADFVRRVSMVTFGFFDSRAPNQHDLDASSLSATWVGTGNQRGVPDFENLAGARAQNSYAISDFVTVIDPPLSTLPGGTSVAVEFRGVDTIQRATIYDKLDNDHFSTRGQPAQPELRV